MFILTYCFSFCFEESQVHKPCSLLCIGSNPSVKGLYPELVKAFWPLFFSKQFRSMSFQHIFPLSLQCPYYISFSLVLFCGQPVQKLIQASKGMAVLIIVEMPWCNAYYCIL